MPFTHPDRAFRLLLIAATLFVAGLECLAGAEFVAGAESIADDSAEVLFVRRVQGILQRRCLGCHGNDPQDLQGQLNLLSPDEAFRGGESGQPAIVAGQPEQSPLYLAVIRTSSDWSAMPPKEADALTPEELGWLRSWIEQGAAWPSETRIGEISKLHAAEWASSDGVTIETSGGLSTDWTNRRYLPDSLWAYRPVQKPALSTDDGRAGNANPVDVLLSELMPRGLSVARVADRRTLIRRATFDLTGLPPTMDDVQRFEQDPRSVGEAFADVVNRLLESPQYGERMAQHWLDVVRYADSSGFSNDYERGNAWRYRDYVVRSFNSDKSYQRFALEQIAGDELEPGNAELLVAVGFLRMGPWELTGMEVPRIARQRFLDDVTNSVGETFLAHSLQCARCHDHKFDPVPTRDYYSIQAAFATTQLAERPAEFLPEENTSNFDERRYLELRRNEHITILNQIDSQLLAAAEQWYVERGLSPLAWRKAVDTVIARRDLQKISREFSDTFSSARSLLLKDGVPEDQFPPRYVGFSPADYGMERVARKGLERLRFELDRYEPVALSVYSGVTPNIKSVNSPMRLPPDPLASGELEASVILLGGDPFSAGEQVHPAGLSVLTSLIPAAQSFANTRNADPRLAVMDQRRLHLANWITDSKNPLFSRTMANRIWQWHFGRGLAANPNNFGTTGQRPTHPRMLDWLAATFVESGWSVEQLHRIIMNSDAYRRSSIHPAPEQLRSLDPEHNSYAVFQLRRLSAEEISDALLASTGELNLTAGGIPNRPEINSDVAMQPRQVMGTFAAAWIPNALPENRHRRALYHLKLRGLSDPMREVFNAPSSDFSCERRETSVVTPQAFALFNSPAVHTRALALAVAVTGSISSTSSDEECVQECFQRTLQRRATVDELQSCLNHWRRVTALIGTETPQAALVPPLVIERTAVEENTGERFSFREQLFENQHFVADINPEQIDARTRALADLCLVLFNSSEFLHVD